MKKLILGSIFILMFGLTGCSKFLNKNSQELNKNLLVAQYSKKVEKTTKNSKLRVTSYKLYKLNKYIYENGATKKCSKRASDLAKNLKTAYYGEKNLKQQDSIMAEMSKSLMLGNILVINTGLKEICPDIQKNY